MNKSMMINMCQSRFDFIVEKVQLPAAVKMKMLELRPIWLELQWKMYEASGAKNIASYVSIIQGTSNAVMEMYSQEVFACETQEELGDLMRSKMMEMLDLEVSALEDETLELFAKHIVQPFSIALQNHLLSLK